MCCILCEEPVRSITFGLAALGVVAIVNGTRRFVARGKKSTGEADTTGTTTAASDIAVGAASEAVAAEGVS